MTIERSLLMGSSGSQGFSLPQRMNGSSTVAYMQAVAVNSSGLFVAVGYDSSDAPVFATSSNGTTWTTPAKMNGSSAYARMLGVTVNSSGRFVAVGYTNPTGTNTQAAWATSTDGSTWTTPATLSGGTNAFLKTVAVNSSGRFVAAGGGTIAGSTGTITTTSTDGTTWSGIALQTALAVYCYYLAVNSTGTFSGVGSDGNFKYPYSMYTTDGSTWSSATTMGGATSEDVVSTIACSSAGRFVALGRKNSAPQATKTSTSTDGISWTNPTSLAPNFNPLGMAVNSGKKFVAVGVFGGKPASMTTFDGLNWTSPVVMGGTSSYFTMNGVSCNSSGLFVSVGYDSSDAPVYAVYRS